MTVLTMPAQPDQATALRPVPWRRMAWVTWRQHRPTLISVPAVLAAVAVFLLIAGLKIHHDYAMLTACHPATSYACQNLNSDFNSTDWTMANTILILLNLAPALIGAFAGAPILARGAGDRRLPVRLDPGFRPGAVDDRQARPHRGHRHRRGRDRLAGPPPRGLNRPGHAGLSSVAPVAVRA
jgi:hypothetical protein